MNTSRRKLPKVSGCSSFRRATIGKETFSSPLALGLRVAVPGAKDPVDAILWHARALILEAGICGPPFPPASYAALRGVTSIVEKELDVEGRLVPTGDSFVIELRRDRSLARKNFTCAHELAHTFFYEAVPSIKYRSVLASPPRQCKEEEMLCNIAAAELLMPTARFCEVAKCYSPTPQSLLDIAQLFQTSILATAVRLSALNLWNVEFVLWQGKGDEVAAVWYAKPNKSLLHYPSLRIHDYQSSGMSHTLLSGENTSRVEWISSGDRYKSCRIQSMRLRNSQSVLSCIARHSSHSTYEPALQENRAAGLSLNYDCECEGTGWRRVEKSGQWYVARCLAPKHKSIR